MKTITTLSQAEKYLEQYLSSTWSYTLERMQQLMNALGNPEKKQRIIHVGGTAGKGSTCHMAAAILHEAGYKVGLHTSPHLISITERLILNGTPISDEKFVSLLNNILPIVEKIKPTYYEITVAMMFTYFFGEKVDIAVVEVGLGGKLDGTNVLTPAVSVVTNVGLDHMEILGDTVEKIVMDKREIIKPGIPAVSGVTQESIRNLIIEKATSVGAPLYLLGRDFTTEHVPPLALLGSHQKTNAALAIEAIKHCGLPVLDTHITRALANLTIAGRLEVDKRMVIDGAHNPMKMTALAQALADHFPNKTFPTLFAVKGDKQVAEMIELLAPHVSHWYATTLERQTDWGKRVMYDALDLAKVISQVDPKKPVTIIPHFPEFLEKNSEQLLITGSLYLVGAVAEWKKNH